MTNLIDFLNSESIFGLVEGLHMCAPNEQKPIKKGIKMGKTFKPGEKAPASGQYERIGPRGARSGHEVTVVKNEPLPPTPKSGERYIIVDRTKNKSGGK